MRALKHELPRAANRLLGLTIIALLLAIAAGIAVIAYELAALAWRTPLAGVTFGEAALGAAAIALFVLTVPRDR